MVFASPVFLCLFLPLFLIGYYALPYRQRSLAIVVGSYVFYGWWRVDFLLLLVAVTVFNYVVAQRIAGKRKRCWLTLGVVGNLCVLGVFKYADFTLSLLGMGVLAIILPIGISFYIFQSISLLVDVARGDAAPPKRFVDFAAYIALFPQLIAGPIIRYKDIAGQFISRAHSWELFTEGAWRFMMGFCCKVLIADSLAPLADRAFASEAPGFADAWLGALAYTFQLYFDFAGYSHMAIGLGLMMGFRFLENFNQPYISRSITEFWRRWHISLSRWLKDYLYIPLGGNRKGSARTYINLFITMVLGGLWHGANITFVLWGAWHGAWLAVERAISAKRGNPYPTMFAWPITFLLVVLGWVMFRAPDVAGAFTLYQAMTGLKGFGFSPETAWQLTGLEVGMLAIATVVTMLAPRLKLTRAPWRQVALSAVFLLAFCKLIAQSHSPFLYFQF